MKYTIYQGRAFTCVFIIKQPDSPTPMDITGSTATFTLSTNGTQSCVFLDRVPMTIYDALNGKFQLDLTAEQTTGLTNKVAFEEDGHPTMATYKALIEIQHPTYGPIKANIPKVYVEDMGSQCVV